MPKEKILILGSTGSIGSSTLDVIALNKERFSVYGLVAGSNIDKLKEQAIAFTPEIIVICDSTAFTLWQEQGYSQDVLRQSGHTPIILTADDLEGVCRSTAVDTVMAAIVGSAGLKPTLACLNAGKKVLLANKESLVLAGHFMLKAASDNHAKVIPVDSEHNAIYQCLPLDFESENYTKYGIERLILTASGGPFRNTPLKDLESVTPAQAIAHPNWSMGPKISVDSSTMANKGLELIEAYWLFGLPADKLSVVIHPQSIVHSLVEYSDASVLAQMGCPDMRTPIAHALGSPRRIPSGSQKLDLATIGKLEFESPDFVRFPMLKLALEALQSPSVLAPIFNAANEVAVQYFLNNELTYRKIYQVVSATMETLCDTSVSCIQGVFELDQVARSKAATILQALR